MWTQLHPTGWVGVCNDSTPFTLSWFLYSLMNITSTVWAVACPFHLQRQGKGTGTQTLVVSVHISMSLHKSTFGDSVIGDAGLCVAMVESQTGNIPCGWSCCGSTSPRGTAGRSGIPHAQYLLHPESPEGTLHLLVPGVSQLMLWWENGAKILLHKCCKGLFLMQYQRYPLWLKILAVELYLPGRNVWGGCF